MSGFFFLLFASLLLADTFSLSPFASSPSSSTALIWTLHFSLLLRLHLDACGGNVSSDVVQIAEVSLRWRHGRGWWLRRGCRKMWGGWETRVRWSKGNYYDRVQRWDMVGKMDAKDEWKRRRQKKKKKKIRIEIPQLLQKKLWNRKERKKLYRLK